MSTLRLAQLAQNHGRRLAEQERGRRVLSYPGISAETLALMFTLVSATGTTVVIRCGLSLTWSGGAENYALTVIDGGSSMDPADTVTITDVTASTWIIGTLDDPNAPTQLTISSTGNTAIPTNNNGTVIPLARITCSGNVITSAYQAHSGPWERWLGGNPDNSSTEFCPATRPDTTPSPRAGLLQDFGFDDVAGVHHAAPGQYAYFPFTPGVTNAEPAPKCWATLVDIFNGCPWDDAEYFVAWLLSFIAYNAPIPEHTNLLHNSSTPGKLGLISDHDARHLVKGAGISVTTEADTPIYSNYASAIDRADPWAWHADGSHKPAIDLSNSRLADAESVNRVTLDWQLRQLYLGWTLVTGDFSITVGHLTLTAGDLTLTAGKLQFADGATDIWQPGTSFKATCPTVLLQKSGSDTKIELNDSGINLNLTEGRTLKVSGNAYGEELVQVIVDGKAVSRYLLTRTP